MQSETNTQTPGHPSLAHRLHGYLERLLPRWAAEISFFAIIGGLQLVLDSLLFLGLTAIGQSIPVANVVGRVAGAVLGFVLNGSITFARNGSRTGIKSQGLRFIIFWCIATTASTFALAMLDRATSLHLVWLAKPLIEAALACISFLVSKHWIYR